MDMPDALSADIGRHAQAGLAPVRVDLLHNDGALRVEQPIRTQLCFDPACDPTAPAMTPRHSPNERCKSPRPTSTAATLWPAVMIPATGRRGAAMSRPRVLAFAAKEFGEMVPPTLFFMVGFNLIVLTGHLLVDDYRRQLFNYMLATTTALLVGKSVLLANALPFLRRLDRAPLVAPILFKTLVYFTVVLIVRFIEEVVEYWVGGGGLNGTLAHLQEEFAWRRFAAVQIWIFVLFLVYTTAAELDELFGHGGLRRILFGRSAADFDLRRRPRTHTGEEPRDGATSVQRHRAVEAARAPDPAGPRKDPRIAGGHRASGGSP